MGKIKKISDWLEHHVGLFSLLTLIFVILLNYLMLDAQTPKANVQGNLYTENDTLGYWFYNSGNKPTMLINFSIFEGSKDTLILTKTSKIPIFIPPGESKQIITNISQNERTEYTLKWCSPEECKEKTYKPDEIPTIITWWGGCDTSFSIFIDQNGTCTAINTGSCENEIIIFNETLNITLSPGESRIIPCEWLEQNND